jgi:hypothetical protein
VHKDPYLVVGTGRSGTSFVAGIMHNDMGIHMGKEFPPANESNPDGFWEDMDFYNLNTALVIGQIPYTKFMNDAIAIVRERREMGIPWGFKESRMGVLLGNYLGLFDKPKIIWCKRKKDLVLASVSKCYEYDADRSYTLYYTRMVMLTRLLQDRDPLIIEFDESTKTKEEIISAIGEKWQQGSSM